MFSPKRNDGAFANAYASIGMPPSREHPQETRLGKRSKTTLPSYFDESLLSRNSRCTIWSRRRFSSAVIMRLAAQIRANSTIFPCLRCNQRTIFWSDALLSTFAANDAISCVHQQRLRELSAFLLHDTQRFVYGGNVQADQRAATRLNSTIAVYEFLPRELCASGPVAEYTTSMVSKCSCLWALHGLSHNKGNARFFGARKHLLRTSQQRVNLLTVHPAVSGLHRRATNPRANRPVPLSAMRRSTSSLSVASRPPPVRPTTVISA